MKSFNKPMLSTHQNFLILLTLVITLFGLNFKATANAGEEDSKTDLVSNSVKLQINNSNLTLLIPKVSWDDANALANSVNGQMVYVSDEKVGFYQLHDGVWLKISVIVALKQAQESIALSTPSTLNMILTSANTQHSNLLDYNAHIKDISNLFDLDKSLRSYSYNDKD